MGSLGPNVSLALNPNPSAGHHYPSDFHKERQPASGDLQASPTSLVEPYPLGRGRDERECRGMEVVDGAVLGWRALIGHS